MPDTISLRAYLAKLEDLLSTNATDEVVHHCRHILQYFPRNLSAYRTLGRALLFNARWDEGRAVFQRVLSVAPDDFIAHVGLSEIYEEQGRANDALWHLERAFEQDSNNKELIDKLRDMQKRHLRGEQGKIQLTAGAVALQYARTGSYDRAVETLRTTLERLPDRVDLRVLLADTLWNSDQRVEAAETALDVLRVLPDCLDANRILTRLWLDEDRPSDAQRYLSRIEAIDPYLALELASGERAPDGAFTLEALDYRRFAQRELATNQPDWLQQLDTSGFSMPTDAPPSVSPLGDWDDWETAAADGSTPSPTLTDDEPLPSADAFTDLPGEWLNDIDDMRVNSGQQTSALRSDLVGIDLTFDDKLDDVEPPMSHVELVASDLKRDTSALANIFAATKPPDSDTLPDWLATDEPDDAIDSAQLSNDASDPLAWLRTSGLDIDDDAKRSFPGFFEDDRDFEHAPVDPLAWMQGSGVELDMPEAPTATAQPPVDDPLAWMHEYESIELEDAPTSAPAATPSTGEMLDWLNSAPTVEMEKPAPTPEPPPEDLFDWLTDDNTTDARATATMSVSAPDDDLSMFDWLQDEPDGNAPARAPENAILGEQRETGDHAFAIGDDGGFLSVPAPHTANVAERENTMSDRDENQPDWMKETPGGSEPNDENADWMESLSFDEDSEPPVAATPDEDVPDWLAALGPDYTMPETLSTTAPPATPNAADFEWIDDQETTNEPAASSVDWLNSIPEPESASIPEAAALEWMSSPDDDEDALPAEGGLPDWLTGAAPAASAASEPPRSEFEWLAAEEDDEQEEQTLEAADVPDWMNALEPPSTAAPVESGDANLEWMSQFEEQDAPAAAALPDWVSDLEPPALAQTDAAASAETFGWANTTPAAPEAAPSWLADMQPDAAPQAADSGNMSFDWSSEVEAEAAGTTESEVEDWLAQIQPDAPTAAPTMQGEVPAEDGGFDWISDFEDAPAAPAATNEVPAEDGGFNWISDFEDDETNAEQPAAQTETPEWLSAVAPAASGVADNEVASEDGGFNWISDFEDDATNVELTAAQSETPEWLSAIQPDDDEEAAPAPSPMMSGEGTLDWSASMDADEDDVLVAPEGDMLNWLSQVQPPADTEQPSLASLPMAEGSDSLDWASSFDDDATSVEQPAAQTSVPGWLTELDPTAAARIESEAANPAQSATDWTSDFEDEGQPAAQADMPDWLAQIQPDDAPVAAAPVSDSGLDWTSDFEDEAALAPAAQDSPDWLTQLEHDDEDELDAVSVGTDGDWLTDVMDSQQEQQDDAAVAAEPSAYNWLNDMTQTELDTATSQPTTELDFSETAVEHAPAQNAPDWLNAMVPGVDLDYEASEDAPIEQDFSEEGASHRERTLSVNAPARDFDWLVDMVEEESGAVAVPAASTATVPAAVEPPKEVRFTFSKPPAWLRGREQTSTPASMSDLPTDGDSTPDDDFDMPDWLK